MAPRTKRANRLDRVDSVRASKDGHQFHEAWVARRALGLLLPRFDLYGIAVEGLSEEDEKGTPAAAVEIADATFYYGNGTSFKTCARMEVGRIPQDLMVDGSWSSPDGVRVNVSSALVPPHQAILATRAVVTAPLMDMWLPSLEPGEDDNGDHVRFGRDVAPLEAWITDPHVELQIDDNDPSGVREALQRPRPASRIIRSFRLRPEQPWANSWVAPGKRVAFRSRAWGRQVGDGDRKDSDSGAALFVTQPFLTDFLTATDRDLLLLIKLQHFRESERYNPADDEPSDRFTHAYSLLLVDRQLRVRPIVPTPADVATVASLDKYSIHDFQKRFTALSKSRGK